MKKLKLPNFMKKVSEFKEVKDYKKTQDKLVEATKKMLEKNKNI